MSYMWTYPKVRSAVVAKQLPLASCRVDLRAVRAWYQAILTRQIARDDEMPLTVGARLRELGSDYAWRF